MKIAISAALSVLLLVASAAVGLAQDDEAHRSDKFDFEAFGRLPVLFNGRVTDLDHFARNALLRISGRETWPDPEGNPLPAVACLLDLMSGRETLRSSPILLVEHAAVRELFKLDPAAEDRHTSIEQIVPHLGAFQERRSDVLASSAKLTGDDLAVLDFSSRLEVLSRLLDVFRAPDFSSGDSMLAGLQQSNELEDQAIPFVVPPKQSGEEWITLTKALIMTHTQAETGVEANPAGEYFAKLIAAYNEDDAATFDQVVRDLALYIKDNCLAACPLRFTVPAGWIEAGTPRLREQYFFTDTRAFGTTVATLNQIAGPDQLRLNVNYFPRGAATKERIANSWRLSLGLAPAPFDKIKMEPVQVAGQAGWRVDIESPPGAPNSSQRTVAVGFTQGEQTWVIACSGPKSLLAKRVAGFDAFVESFVVGSPAEMETWFALPAPEPLTLPAGTKLVLAVVPDKSAAWMLQAAYFAEDKPDEQVKKLRALLKSVKFPTPAAGKKSAASLPFTWKLPQGWVLQTSSDGRLSVVSGETPTSVVLEMQPLKVEGTLSLPILVNQWRANYQLPELPDEEIQASLEKLTVGDRPIVLVVTDLP